MKKILISVLIVIGIILAGHEFPMLSARILTHSSKADNPLNQEEKTDSTIQIIYYCPVHPEVSQTSAGKCPKCGINLTVKKPPETYACPMHPEVVSDKLGICPKCGMNLLPKE